MVGSAPDSHACDQRTVRISMPESAINCGGSSGTTAAVGVEKLPLVVLQAILASMAASTSGSGSSKSAEMMMRPLAEPRPGR